MHHELHARGEIMRTDRDSEPPTQPFGPALADGSGARAVVSDEERTTVVNAGRTRRTTVELDEEITNILQRPESKPT
jgi:hypothetical protein